MRQPSPYTCLLASGAIAGTLLGRDLVRMATARRVPPAGELRSAALSAAAVLAAVGLSGWHTRATLDLARRMEQARYSGTTG